MSTYHYCDACDTCHYAGSCFDPFEVWCPTYGESRTDARIIRAYDSEAAARRFGEMHDAQGDYDIVSGGDVTVHVCEQGTDVIEKFLVTGESVPEYHASSLGVVTTEAESNP